MQKFCQPKQVSTGAPLPSVEGQSGMSLFSSSRLAAHTLASPSQHQLSHHCSELKMIAGNHSLVWWLHVMVCYTHSCRFPEQRIQNDYGDKSPPPQTRHIPQAEHKSGNNNLCLQIKAAHCWLLFKPTLAKTYMSDHLICNSCYITPSS